MKNLKKMVFKTLDDARNYDTYYSGITQEEQGKLKDVELYVLNSPPLSRLGSFKQFSQALIEHQEQMLRDHEFLAYLFEKFPDLVEKPEAKLQILAQNWDTPKPRNNLPFCLAAETQNLVAMKVLTQKFSPQYFTEAMTAECQFGLEPSPLKSIIKSGNSSMFKLVMGALNGSSESYEKIAKILSERKTSGSYAKNILSKAAQNGHK